MWSTRRLRLVGAHPGPVLIKGGPEWGAPYLIAALSQPERPLLWLELAPRDQGDPVLQGNKLADAVRRALGEPLFGYGLPFGYGLDVLRTHLKLIGPFTFALSGADDGLAIQRIEQAWEETCR